MNTNAHRTIGQIALARFALLTLASNLLIGTTNAQTFTTLKSFGILTNVSGFNPNAPLVQGPDGTLYGTTSTGEGNVKGTVFRMQPDGSGFTVLKWFTNDLEGAEPYAGVTLSGSVLYGTTTAGGSAGFGTVFKVNTNGTGFTVLKDFSETIYDPSTGAFTNSDGVSPYAGMTVSGSVLYGTTSAGGSNGFGTVFKLNPDGTGYTVLKHFANSDGASPGLMTVSGNLLYGPTQFGGNDELGTLFKINTDGTGFTVLKYFAGTNGATPSSLTLSGGVLYGTTWAGGGSENGTVFKLNTDGTDFTVLKHFSPLANNTNSDGTKPPAGLTLSGGVLYGTTFEGGTSGQGTVFKMNTDGTGFTVLKHFTYYEGANPLAGVTLSGSTLYGTTLLGGITGFGTVFKVSTDGMDYTVLKYFTYSDGRDPYGDLTFSGGVLYEATAFGGSNGSGTVFKLNTNGTGYTVLKHLGLMTLDPSTGAYTNSDGALPHAGLALLGNTLYGTAQQGGSAGSGTVFKMNTDGTDYAVLKNFSYYDLFGARTNSGGAYPRAGLTLSSNVLYGTTSEGGSSSAGTVFKMNTDGTGFMVLKDFTGVDGARPSGLTLSGSVLYGTTYSGTLFKLNTDGTGFMVFSGGGEAPSSLTLSGNVLYGTTGFGGSSNSGTVFKLNTDGTGYTVLKHFSAVDPGNPQSNSDGAYPYAGVTLSGTTLYGTTYAGGSSGLGTVFKLNTDGTGFTVLKHFTYADGWNPYGGLVLSGSTLYGTTSGDASIIGDGRDGTVFKIELSGSLTPIPLNAQRLGGDFVLNWSNPAFALQAAPEVMGTYTNVPGATSPHTNAISGPQKFFRLIGK